VNGLLNNIKDGLKLNLLFGTERMMQVAKKKLVLDHLIVSLSAIE